METNCISSLPPELLSKIFDYLGRNQVVQLRLVSKHWKAVVDTHQTFVVKMNGFVPSTIPAPSLKFRTLEIKNFLPPVVVQLPEISNQMTRLVSFRLTGPTHAKVVHQILQGAVNLKRLEIEEFGLQYLGTDDSSFPLNNTKKLSKIIIRKDLVCDYASATAGQILQQIVMRKGLVHAVSAMLHQSISLPILTVLVLDYQDLPLLHLQNLVVKTIIPFVQRHCSTLKTLHIGFTTATSIKESRKPEPLPDVEPRHHSLSRLKLASLALCLPDSILNHLLIGIYNINRTSKSVIERIPSMRHIVCSWEKPFVSAPSQAEELAYKIVEQLIWENQIQVKVLYLQNFNSDSIILCTDRIGSYNLKNLTKMTIRGRKANGYVSKEIVPLCQVKIVVQSFPNLTHLRLIDLYLKLKPLCKNILENCNSLETLTLSGNLYYDNIKIDFDLMVDLALKGGMKTITIGSDDFCTPFESSYWVQFKRIFEIYKQKRDINNNCIVFSR